MSTLRQIVERAKLLRERSGGSVSSCLPELVSALMPCGEPLIKGIDLVFQHAFQFDLGDEERALAAGLDGLEVEGITLMQVLDLALKPLSPLLEQLIETHESDDLEGDQRQAFIRRQCATALCTQPAVNQARHHLVKLQLSLVPNRRALDQLIQSQVDRSSALKEMQREVTSLLELTLSFSSSLEEQTLTTHRKKAYYQIHHSAQRQLLEGRLKPLEESVLGLQEIEPHHPMTLLCQASLECLRLNFDDARALLDGLPDELTRGSLLEVKQALDQQRGARDEVEPEDYSFENEDGEVCLGMQGWHHVIPENQEVWHLENLAQGWLLHRRPEGPKRSRQWSVMSLEGEAGALHVIQGHLTRRGDYYRRFRAEASSLKSVNHPKVLRVLDWGRTPDKDPYLVTEPLKGETLEDRLALRHLSPDEMKQLGSSLFESLSACHDQGITHFNIHPCTIHFREDNTPVLTGFGVSCQDLELDEHGRRKDPYASPEQRRGDPLTSATDIYSLGSILIDSVGGMQALPSAWRPALQRFVSPIPSARPPSQVVTDTFQTFTSKYYLVHSGEPARGPYSVKEVARRILQGQREAKLQRVGSLTVHHWQEVEEVARHVSELEAEMKQSEASQGLKPSMISAQARATLNPAEEDLSAENPLRAPSLEEDQDEGVEPTSEYDFSSGWTSSAVIKSNESLRGPPQTQRVQKEYQWVTSSSDRRFVKDEGASGYAPSSEVIALGDYAIKLFTQGDELRSQYISVSDARSLAQRYDPKSDEAHFLTEIQNRSNSRGDLLVAAQGDVSHFVSLLDQYLSTQGRGLGERLTFTRVGGKGLFQLIIKPEKTT